MKKPFYFNNIPRTRVASFDTFSVGMKKHHISALLEFDVTESRKKLRELRKQEIPVSFNGWLIKVISAALQKHPEASAFLYSKKKLILFNDIHVSFMVEKVTDGKRVPIPLVIEKTGEKTASEITAEIEKARTGEISDKEMVLQRKTTYAEKLYYQLPGFLRRAFWKFLLNHPKTAFRKMGNVMVTSVGTMGVIKGWFIHTSVHPVSFGIGSILQKPAVIDGEVKIRDILHMTVLMDHDVIDGAPMVRFIHDLTRYIETGKFIDQADA